MKSLLPPPLDPRVKVALALAFGVLILVSGPVGLGLYALALAAGAFLARGNFSQGERSARFVFKSYLFFLVFWVAAKGVLDALSGLPIQEVLVASSLLGLRLVCLLLMGLLLAFTASPRRLGLAVAWYLRPVTGKHAWKAALALSLMIHYLPLALASLDRARFALRARGVRPGRIASALVILKGALRSLSWSVESQATAIAARGLDRPEAWQEAFPSAVTSVAAGALLAGSGLLLALL